MSEAFHDVYDSSEIDVSIADEYDEDSEEWNFERVVYRRSFNPDIPDNTRAVYDKLNYRGSKLTRAEKTLSIGQEFQGFGEGLDKYAEMNGLLVKAEINPNQGDPPTDNTRYYTNWSPGALQWPDVSDEGEFDVSLEGNFDEVTDEEPDGSEDWATTA